MLQMLGLIPTYRGGGPLPTNPLALASAEAPAQLATPLLARACRSGSGTALPQPPTLSSLNSISRTLEQVSRNPPPASPMPPTTEQAEPAGQLETATSGVKRAQAEVASAQEQQQQDPKALRRDKPPSFKVVGRLVLAMKRFSSEWRLRVLGRLCACPRPPAALGSSNCGLRGRGSWCHPAPRLWHLALAQSRRPPLPRELLRLRAQAAASPPSAPPQTRSTPPTRTARRPPPPTAAASAGCVRQWCPTARGAFLSLAARAPPSSWRAFALHPPHPLPSPPWLPAGQLAGGRGEPAAQQTRCASAWAARAAAGLRPAPSLSPRPPPAHCPRAHRPRAPARPCPCRRAARAVCVPRPRQPLQLPGQTAAAHRGRGGAQVIDGELRGSGRGLQQRHAPRAKRYAPQRQPSWPAQLQLAGLAPRGERAHHSTSPSLLSPPLAPSPPARHNSPLDTIRHQPTRLPNALCPPPAPQLYIPRLPPTGCAHGAAPFSLVCADRRRSPLLQC